ncbi:hypothetical protein [Thiomicrorhabdus indica]|uniref:hypothetical protein n=1 Tax=Thiomicrorhabdus indica TaxID=2267253 RepID=UPI002AA88202|nr:hypothetical protein [Thiomicrorhabdus indica]
MLCLFRNSLIHPRLDPVAVALSWAATLYWLYFAFIEKALWSKILQGEAIIIDLVFGLPLVLAFAIMTYASVYWSFKLILVLLYPAGLTDKPSNEIDDSYENESNQLMEKKLGEDYWHQKEEAQLVKPNNNSQKNDSNHR